MACAASLKAYLPAGQPLYSSPLQRCRYLAQALHPEPIYDPRLQEMNFGAWEMRAWNEIPRAEVDEWAADLEHFAPPGGESMHQVRLRVRSFLQDLDGEAVIVSHAGVMKLIAAEMLYLTPQECLALNFDYASATLIDRNGIIWTSQDGKPA